MNVRVRIYGKNSFLITYKQIISNSQGRWKFMLQVKNGKRLPKVY